MVLSQSEVNELKSHINQLVLGTSQTYLNNLRQEIFQLVTGVEASIVFEVQTQARVEREILWSILEEVRHLYEWDESELTG